MINFEEFQKLYTYVEGKKLDPDQFAESYKWKDWMRGQSIDEVGRILRCTVDIANNGFQAIKKHFKNLKQIGDMFRIPYYTLVKWSCGEREPSEAWMILMAYATVNFVDGQNVQESTCYFV